MEYFTQYKSPIGTILIRSSEDAITGLWFENQKTCPAVTTPGTLNQVLHNACSWLDRYFDGEPVTPRTLPLAPKGTAFQHLIWGLLLQIPFGEVVTYGALAAKASKLMGVPKMSPQAVGHAVGQNPISILIPCHRVIGANGKLTGYAGGLERKRFLLELEA